MFQDLFIDYLIQDLQELKGVNLSTNKLRKVIIFLINSGLISTTTIRHFTVIREYEKMVDQGTFRNKTLLIRAMARRFDTHENTIWNILKDHKLKYQSSSQEGG